MPWNPDLYHKFQSERFAPFDDLVALVERKANLTVVDLGCGTGELTRRLADVLPDSDVIGIDSSAEMLARAQLQVRSGLHFEQRTIEQIDGQYDLVFSHAALQWVDDHNLLIPRLVSLVHPGGQIAVQMPSNHRHYSHRTLTQTADEEPFRQALGGWSRKSPVLSIEDYADLLYANGTENITVIEKVYPHVLENADAVVEWVSGTALVPYLERLPQPLAEPFIASYRAKLRAHWPSSPVFYGFRRTLFAATKQ